MQIRSRSMEYDVDEWPQITNYIETCKWKTYGNNARLYQLPSEQHLPFLRKTPISI